MFLKIDNWLFDKVFQRLSDWLMDTYGRGCHWLAATCAYLYAAGIIVGQLYFPNHSWLTAALDVILLLVVLSIAARNDQEDKKKIKQNAVAMNSLRARPLFQFLRITSWPILFLNISDIFRNDIETSADIFRSFQSFIFLCILYFESCNTRPPKPKQQKEETLVATPTTR